MAGGRWLDYVAFRLRSDLTVTELLRKLEATKVYVIVNGSTIAESWLHQLAMEPAMSGRMVFHLEYAVTEGDEVTCEMRNEQGVKLDGGLDIEAELSIVGEIELGLTAPVLQEGAR